MANQTIKVVLLPVEQAQTILNFLNNSVPGTRAQHLEMGLDTLCNFLGNAPVQDIEFEVPDGVSAGAEMPESTSDTVVVPIKDSDGDNEPDEVEDPQVNVN